MNDPLKPSLDEQLAGLAREVAPPRNLWPGIAGQLRQRPQRSRPIVFAVAAGAAGACLASALTWALLHGRSMHAPSFEEPRDPRYVAARHSLEIDFRERLALLDPVTRGKIEASLATIRQAHEDIRKALADDPQSPLLEQLWQSTWHDELDLYEHVVRTTEPTMTRT
jgi:hypothetical protein